MKRIMLCILLTFTIVFPTPGQKSALLQKMKAWPSKAASANHILSEVMSASVGRSYAGYEG